MKSPKVRLSEVRENEETHALQLQISKKVRTDFTDNEGRLISSINPP